MQSDLFSVFFLSFDGYINMNFLIIFFVCFFFQNLDNITKKTLKKYFRLKCAEIYETQYNKPSRKSNVLVDL